MDASDGLPTDADDPVLDVDDETDLGSVEVQTAALLLVDPCHLPVETVRRLLTPDERGIAPALLVGLIGDGTYDIVSTPGAVEVLDPYGDHGYPHHSIDEGQWRELTDPPLQQ